MVDKKLLIYSKISTIELEEKKEEISNPLHSMAGISSGGISARSLSRYQ